MHATRIDDVADAPALIGEVLTLESFARVAGTLSGCSFVKLVVDRSSGEIHFISNAHYQFHGYYIAEQILGITRQQLEADVDTYNYAFYADPERHLYLGLLSWHRHPAHGEFFCLETVEVDIMSAAMLRYLYGFVRAHVDPALPLLLKPASHRQEEQLAAVSEAKLPRIAAHEIFSAASYVVLQPGTAEGRMRVFRDEASYRRADPPLEWYDIIAMERVPDDVPRLAGIVNARYTTPLSHTNVLAASWGVPNAIQLGALDRIERDGLDGTWVRYEVDLAAAEIRLTPIPRPAAVGARPAWTARVVTVAPPKIGSTPIVDLAELSTDDVSRYGTKAANLGELLRVLAHGSDRLLGWYQVPRALRPNLLGHLRGLLGPAKDSDLPDAARSLLREFTVPRGLALPFALQREFLESSPELQQAIDKLKLAVELGGSCQDELVRKVYERVLVTPVPDALHRRIDAALAAHLSGAGRFVVRSSSNAEDLAGFSAAGIYDSVIGVTTASEVIMAIRTVWASLLSPRSVRLRLQAGISLGDAYMGVVIQEQVAGTIGGVMVTTNPLNPADFRNVYLNVSTGSVENVVSGVDAPIQYLFNTVEGGGRTLSLGDAARDLTSGNRRRLERLALAGRLLQAHFSPDNTFTAPAEVEWVADRDRIAIVQLRPYSH